MQQESNNGQRKSVRSRRAADILSNGSMNPSPLVTFMTFLNRPVQIPTRQIHSCTPHNRDTSAHGPDVDGVQSHDNFYSYDNMITTHEQVS
jgi:hypothetical protein